MITTFIYQIGTYTMALCAKEMNKPFYVLAESFKFVRLYPLNGRDLPKELMVIIPIIRTYLVYLISINILCCSILQVFWSQTQIWLIIILKWITHLQDILPFCSQI